MAREVFNVDVQGLDQFRKNLARVSSPRRTKAIMRQSLNAGAVPLKKRLRAEIKSAGAVRKGHLRRAVISVVKQYPTGVSLIIVGIRYHKTSDGENPGNYFHLVDLGTRPHEMATRPVHIDDLGQYRQRRDRGGSTHPGSYGQLMKYRAQVRAWPKVYPAVFKRVETLVAKELTKGA